MESSEIEGKMLDEYLEKCGVSKEIRKKAHTPNIESFFRNMDVSYEKTPEHLKNFVEESLSSDKKLKKKEAVIYNIPSSKEMNF